MGAGLIAEECGVAKECLLDDVLHELTIASMYRGSGADDDRGAMKEDGDRPDDEEEALRTAERLVYGWPSRGTDPTGAHSRGRFVKSFPLEFPMGIGDLNEERPRKVSVEEWVQHLLRYKTGHFVGGQRCQRVL